MDDALDSVNSSDVSNKSVGSADVVTPLIKELGAHLEKHAIYKLQLWKHTLDLYIKYYPLVKINASSDTDTLHVFYQQYDVTMLVESIKQVFQEVNNLMERKEMWTLAS